MSPAAPSLWLLPECVHTKETEGNLAGPWFFSGVASLLAWLPLFCSFTFKALSGPCHSVSPPVSMLGLLLLLENLPPTLEALFSPGSSSVCVLPPSPLRALLSQPVRVFSRIPLFFFPGFHFLTSPFTLSLINLIHVHGHVCPLTLSPCCTGHLLCRLSTQTSRLLVISTWMLHGS